MSNGAARLKTVDVPAVLSITARTGYPEVLGLWDGDCDTVRLGLIVVEGDPDELREPVCVGLRDSDWLADWERLDVLEPLAVML